jgi:[ribosomal protein S18]-alanine N-acetyltransferase
VKVRQATLEDCEPLAAGMRSVVEEGRWLATESNTSVEELRERFRQAVESREQVLLILEEDGELLGSVGMHPSHARGVLSLGMWVLPEWRGRGGGRLLMEAALKARPEDAHKIELEVFDDNAAAIGLYRSMGFEQEGLRRDHYRRLDGSLRSAVIMARLF